MLDDVVRDLDLVGYRCQDQDYGEKVVLDFSFGNCTLASTTTYLSATQQFSSV